MNNKRLNLPLKGSVSHRTLATEEEYMKRWSKLQKELYLIIDPEIDFQIHCAVYPMRSDRATSPCPRYWITIGKEIIFDYPKDFVDKDGHVSHHHAHIPQTAEYPYYCDISFISNLIREYIDTPVSDILTRRFENDYWGLTDIFRAADKRIGKRRLEILRDSIKNQAAQIIVELRVNKQQTD